MKHQLHDLLPDRAQTRNSLLSQSLDPTLTAPAPLVVQSPLWIAPIAGRGRAVHFGLAAATQCPVSSESLCRTPSPLASLVFGRRWARPPRNWSLFRAPPCPWRPNAEEISWSLAGSRAAIQTRATSDPNMLPLIRRETRIAPTPWIQPTKRCLRTSKSVELLRSIESDPRDLTVRRTHAVPCPSTADSPRSSDGARRLAAAEIASQHCQQGNAGR